MIGLRKVFLVASLIVMGTVSGCASNHEESMDVFSSAPTESPVAPEMNDARITFTPPADIEYLAATAVTAQNQKVVCNSDYCLLNNQPQYFSRNFPTCGATTAYKFSQGAMIVRFGDEAAAQATPCVDVLPQDQATQLVKDSAQTVLQPGQAVRLSENRTCFQSSNGLYCWNGAGQGVQIVEGNLSLVTVQY